MRMSTALALVLSLTSLASAQQTRRPAPRTPAARPEPRREAAVPFRVGETLTYDVSWSGFLVAGTAVVHVVEKKASYNSTAYHIVADGRPLPLVARLYPLYYKMDSLVDSFTTLSQWTSLYTEEGSRHQTASTRFDRPARKAYYEAQASTPSRATLPIPPDVQDGLATMYALRARSFRPGVRFSIPVADNGSLYTAEFEPVGAERVRVKLGEIDAWHLKVTIRDLQRQTVGSNIAMWISTDARRLPVRLQADLPVGTFALDLRAAQ